jgi:protein suppressor of PHYA-105 1
MQESSVGTIKTKANVCCIQFPPDSGHLLAFGSADYKVYVYDLRTTKLPLCTLASHQKAVSYVKFVDSVTLVSASTDNTLKLWDLTRANTAPHAQTGCSLTYTDEKVTALVSWCFIC